MICTKTSSSYVISHPDSIIYENYKLNPNLFEIRKEFISSSSISSSISSSSQSQSQPRRIRKRDRELSLSETASFVSQFYSEELPKIKVLNLPFFKSDSKPEPEPEDTITNELAVQTAQRFYSLTKTKNDAECEFRKFNGGNPTDQVVISEVPNDHDQTQYLFPPRCRFFNCDLFSDDVNIDEMFDLVVLDPPWRNKFIKRRKGNVSGYVVHDTEEIGEQLGKFFPSILNEDGVVAIWATNSKVDVILKEFLPKWGLSHLSTFYWLKVTKSLSITTPYTKENGKQPFESLILASRVKTTVKIKPKLVISTPSSINSHKPPLTSLLEDVFDRKFTSKCELFARYLQSDYTCYGNEVCKLNNLTLFQKY